MAEIILTYLGPNWIPDVPARDLTADDIAVFSVNVEELVKSGLYGRTGKQVGKETKSSVVGKTLTGDLAAVKDLVDKMEDSE